MGELVNPSEAQGMCPLKAKNLSGVDVLLTLPQVLANLHPPSTPPADTTADPASASDHQHSVAAWEGTSCLTPPPTTSSQSCKNGYIRKSCGCVCVAVLTGVPERQR